MGDEIHPLRRALIERGLVKESEVELGPYERPFLDTEKLRAEYIQKGLITEGERYAISERSAAPQISAVRERGQISQGNGRKMGEGNGKYPAARKSSEEKEHWADAYYKYS